MTRHWRVFNILVNGVGVPCVVMLLFTEESPRWLVQKHRYHEAAKSINKIARWNGRSHIQYTEADMKAIELSSKAKQHNYSIFHLFSQKKLAIYCVSQIATGICINTVGTVILFNVQDLAGSPFLNIALMGILRLWAPAAAVAMERYSSWFGRKSLLIGSQGEFSPHFSSNANDRFSYRLLLFHRDDHYIQRGLLGDASLVGDRPGAIRSVDTISYKCVPHSKASCL